MSEVVVGVDGSAAAAGALQWAAEHAGSSARALRVLHVWDMPPGLAGAATVGAGPA